LARFEHNYDVTGIATKLGDSTIELTDLPIYKWAQNHKAEATIGEKGDGIKVCTRPANCSWGPNQARFVKPQGGRGDRGCRGERRCQSRGGIWHLDGP
jgi:hypothetical protein